MSPDADPAVGHRRARPALLVAGVVAAFGGLFVLLPRIAGLDDAWGRIREGHISWMLLAGVLEIGSYGGYVAVLYVVAGGPERLLTRRDAWRLTLAGVAASRLFATAGAGGIALTAWALTRLGMTARTVTTRLATFFVLLYSIYIAALLICGVGLAAGWLTGPSPFALTVAPALFAAAVIAAALALALIPPEVIDAGTSDRHARLQRTLAFAAKAPAVIGSGVRGTIALLRDRDPVWVGAAAWWGCDVLVLWATIHGFGGAPPAAVLIMSYFVGQLANTLPLPGGIGGVEGGMVGALIAFGEPAGLALAGVLTYRAFAFWLPTLPGAVAYVRLTHALGSGHG
jgi:uncharacterized membrane protein YbhN (UPF0104 family)